MEFEIIPISIPIKNLNKYAALTDSSRLRIENKNL